MFKEIIAICSFLLLLIILFCYLYFVEIYEVKYSIEKIYDYDGSVKGFVITSVPVNATGSSAWFRNTYFDFAILEGEDSVQNAYKLSENQLVILVNSEFTPIVLELNSKYSSFSSILEINSILDMERLDNNKFNKSYEQKI